MKGKVAIVTGGGSGLGEAMSDEASFMTGGYYLVDGGYTAV
jgi:NADP-dependent 3-hydroxy acid dehydrogenase YdfG